MEGSDCVDILSLSVSFILDPFLISQLNATPTKSRRTAHLPSDVRINGVDSGHGILKRLRNLILKREILGDVGLVVPASLA